MSKVSFWRTDKRAREGIMLRTAVLIRSIVATVICGGALASCTTIERREGPGSPVTMRETHEEVGTVFVVQGDGEQLVRFNRALQRDIGEGRVICKLVVVERKVGEKIVETEVSDCENLTA